MLVPGMQQSLDKHYLSNNNPLIIPTDKPKGKPHKGFSSKGDFCLLSYTEWYQGATGIYWGLAREAPKYRVNIKAVPPQGLIT